MPTLDTRRLLRAAGALATAATLAGPVGGCARNPVTGQQELALVSEDQEIALGRQSAQEVAQSIGLVQDEALQQYVQRVGATLAAESERPRLPWSFRAVDDPTPNAFALPGGFIFVTRGLLGLMNSEAELASVLGHEIGHVTARHSVQQMSRAQLAQVGLGIGAILSPEIAQYGQLASTGLQLLFLKYGRDAERQADDLGFKYALQDNYDVREMVDVFAALGRAGEASGQSPLPTWLATHPYPAERIERTEARLKALDRPLTNAITRRPEYLERVDGLVYGENPRHGFFEGSTFYHPDMRFRLDFPSGWQAQNMTQGVVAVSQQQDGIVQLTLAQQQDPATATRAFLSQQGIQAGRTFQESVNGIPAAGSYFQAQTEQGVIQGIAAFFSFGGRTFQIMSYAPTGKLEQYDPVFRRTLASFSAVNDPRILSVQPARVDVVRVDQRMSLAEFARRHQTSASVDELARLNQLSGPDAPLAVGDMVKVVVGGMPTAG
jgi:predicted Zn-dependent protease